MSTTEATETWADRVPRTPKREQQPWGRPEDAKGWTRIYRGRGRGKPPLMSVRVDLNAAQSEWLRAEAERTGLDYVTLVERLIEEKRAAPAS